MVINVHAWALGGGGLLGCLPPPGQKVNVTGIPTPESKSKLITYRYRQKPPRIFPRPRMVMCTFCVVPQILNLLRNLGAEVFYCLTTII